MGKGKIAGQVGHVSGLITEDILKKYYENKTDTTTEAYDRYVSWKQSGHAKIILKATEAELLSFIGTPECIHIRDAGRTQIEPNTLTVVGFYPTNKSKDKFSSYKLL
jgi:peptidyl-tRNA hydrolase